MADTLDDLLPILRLKLGDTDITSARYLDDWLRTALAASVSSLSRYWDNKYSVDSDNYISRNSSYAYFETTTPVIQDKDAWIIVLQASIIVKSGQLENVSWSLGSWKDAELGASNIESGKQKDTSLQRDLNELNSLIKVPMKRAMIPSRTNYTLITPND